MPSHNINVNNVNQYIIKLSTVELFIATSYPEKAKELTGSLDGIIRILWYCHIAEGKLIGKTKKI